MDISSTFIFSNYKHKKYSEKELYEMVAHKDSSKWPEGIAGIIQAMNKSEVSSYYKRAICKKILEVYEAKAEYKISPEEKDAIWECWKTLGDDNASQAAKEQYIMHRLNVATRIPMELKNRVQRGLPYQEFYHQFFREKSAEWREIPPDMLEDWFLEITEEFRSRLTKAII